MSLVVSMGSPWSVYDTRRAAMLASERACVAQALTEGIPVLGVCFGAQLLASVLGGDVRRANHPEVGWGTLEVLEEGSIDPGPWLNWHHDTFSVPSGARVLARTGVGPQAFDGPGFFGVQFHPEVTPLVMHPWLKVGESDLAAVGRRGRPLLLETGLRSLTARRRGRRLLGRFLDRSGVC